MPSCKQRKCSSELTAPRVALFIDTENVTGRRILKGIGDYIRQNVSWTICWEPRAFYDFPSHFRNWRGDGILARFLFPGVLDFFRESGIPVVNLNEHFTLPDFPLVCNDNEKIGELAADQLCAAGLTNFAYVGYPDILWSEERGHGFIRKLSVEEFVCFSYQGPKKSSVRRQDGKRSLSTPKYSKQYYQLIQQEEQDYMCRWLRSLPRPIGILACCDYRAIQVMKACRECGFSIPEQVVLVGVDDDELLCNLYSPTLSSILPDSEKVGSTAAKMLTRLMAGEKLSPVPQLVPPRDFIRRQSTDYEATDDSLIQAALKVIRQRALLGLSTLELAKILCVSRSTVERRFDAVLGRSVHDTILLERLNYVKSLLLDTKDSFEEIARESGFESSSYLSAQFRKYVGMSMRDFRKR